MSRPVRTTRFVERLRELELLSRAEPHYLSESLNPDRHDLDGFHCSEPDLDDWLIRHALGAEARRVARTFVWIDENESVVAYYSLVGHRLVRNELPKSMGHGSPAEIPSVLLARLALAEHLHGQGLGGAVLADAMERVVQATQIVAARFVVVDALHEQAAAFYCHHGFRRVPDTLRLVQKISDVAVSLGD